MRIPLTEPTEPRYITIKQETNQVHLIVPIVGGQEISTDNTCKATVALRDFFDGGALLELNAYKDALAFDIQLLEVGDPQRVGKEARLAQIETYIGAVSAMRQSYGDAMNALLRSPSNLYGIQLRPLSQDSQSRVINPAFNIERTNNAEGNPLSALYNAMHNTFPSVNIGVPDPRTMLTTAVLSALSASPHFKEFQCVLREQCLALFGLSIDFTQRADASPITKEAIHALMGFEDDATSKDYIDALLYYCAENLWIDIPTSPFYKVSNIAEGLTIEQRSKAIDERTERFSILTQFFLGIVNIYCRARGISAQNFGAKLDASNDLSKELVSVIAEALSAGDEVEGQLCAFCNVYATELGLSRTLGADDIAAIKEKFERTYRTVTATKENPHMDDFMILDCDATGDIAKFVTHQGSICTDFAQIVEAALPNQGYFAHVREDFKDHPAEMPHKNEWVAGDVEIEPGTLLARITDDQFERLPDAIKVACRAHPTFQIRQFLPGVAKGRQGEVDALLTASPANMQNLLRTPGVFTDYAGRTFNCTAYEYAYWAKDTHMCRMLERHMNDETKAELFARIKIIEGIDTAADQPVGLVYQQRGTEHRSAHFDLTQLISALQRYVDGYDNWVITHNWNEMRAAWMEVGIQQRDLPVHVLNEYCRPDRSFYPRPEFNEEALPRSVTFYNYDARVEQSLFPLVISDASSLGTDFAVLRANAVIGAAGLRCPVRLPLGLLDLGVVLIDLAAVSRLDVVRNEDLTCSRENLQPKNMGLSHSMLVK